MLVSLSLIFTYSTHVSNIHPFSFPRWPRALVTSTRARWKWRRQVAKMFIHFWAWCGVHQHCQHCTEISCRCVWEKDVVRMNIHTVCFIITHIFYNYLWLLWGEARTIIKMFYRKERMQQQQWQDENTIINMYLYCKYTYLTVTAQTFTVCILYVSSQLSQPSRTFTRVCWH